MVPSALMAWMVCCSYWLGSLKEGDMTMVSLTAHPELLATEMVVAPASAVCLRAVLTLPGACP